MNPTHHVIFSGGMGSRLWPISRRNQPKQYLRLFGDKSLFRLTLERNQSLCDHTVVVGNCDNYTLSRADLDEAGITDYTEIIEATPRNTAAAIAFAALAVPADGILLVTPSDHIITDQPAYQAAMQRAQELAAAGNLVTFGLVPTRPDTGYGYIEAERTEVCSFREKPDAATAQAFCDSGRFLCNSGMFCFRADRYLHELGTLDPELLTTATRAWEARTVGDRVGLTTRACFLPEAESRAISSRSVDYAVMERTTALRVIAADLGWSDLGSFESLWDYFNEHHRPLSFVQDNLVLGTTKHVEFLGVENIVLVNTPDALLVMNKSHAQSVKQIYERLEREKPELV